MSAETIIRCPKCASGLRVRIAGTATAVKVTCPNCSNLLLVRPKPPGAPVAAPPGTVRRALIGDEPRPFRDFLSRELAASGFVVELFEDGRQLLERARESAPQLFVLNVYLRGMLGVEVCEAVKADPSLASAKVVFIGALFRANRYRSNPTNLYGADEYIEEIISAEEFRALVQELFPGGGVVTAEETPLEKELDEARRLARIIVSDLVLYHPEQFSRGIREGNLDALLGPEIAEARAYFDSRLGERVRSVSSFFDDTLRDYVDRRSREARG